MRHLPGRCGFALSRGKQFRIEMRNKPSVELTSYAALPSLIVDGISRVVVVNSQSGDGVEETVVVHRPIVSLTWRVGD